MKAAIAAAIHGELGASFKSPPNAFDLASSSAASSLAIKATAQCQMANSSTRKMKLVSRKDASTHENLHKNLILLVLSTSLPCSFACSSWP